MRSGASLPAVARVVTDVVFTTTFGVDWIGWDHSGRSLSWDLGVGCRMLGVGCRMLDSDVGCRMLGCHCAIRNSV